MPIWMRSGSVRVLAVMAFVLGVLVAGTTNEVVGESPGLVPLGGEFVVESGGGCNPGWDYSIRENPTVSDTTSGDFVVAWGATCDYPIGDCSYVFARRLGSDGGPLGQTVEVRHWCGDSWGWNRDSARGADNGFVVAYNGGSQWWWYSYKWVGGRIFDGNDDYVGSVPSNSYSYHVAADDATVATDGAGNIVLAWRYSVVDGIAARLSTAAGAPLTDEFRVNTHLPGLQKAPSVARAPDGRFVVVWESEDQDGSGFGIFGQRFDPIGTPDGGEFPINSWTPGDQRLPVVVMMPDGGFVVVWVSDDGDGLGVVGRLFAPDGNPLGEEFLIPTQTVGDQSDPSVVLGVDGGFRVVWIGPDGDDTGVFMRGFSGDGSPDGREMRVNDTTVGSQAEPRVAGTNDGPFVVAWRDGGLQLPGHIMGRLFGPPFVGGLVSYWGFDDGDGSAVVSDIFGTNHGQLQNMSPTGSWSTGKFGGALSFGGSPEFVLFGNDISLDVTRGMSLAAWVRPAHVVGRQAAFAKDLGAGSNSYILFTANDWNPHNPDGPRGLLVVEDEAAGHVLKADPPSPLAPNAWNHVVMTYDAGDGMLRYWVNGQVRATAFDSERRLIQITSASLVAGAKTTLEHFYHGRIDDAALWNRALSETEISALWNEGRGRSLDELLDLVMFDGFDTGDTWGWSVAVP